MPKGIQAQRHFVLVSIAFLISFTLFPSIAFAGNSFMTGQLRIDPPEVYSAHDYIVSIDIGSQLTSGASADFTTGWLGIHVPDFVQVGFMAKTTGVRWFVEEFSSSVTIQCFQGTFISDIGGGGEACYGTIGDRVSLNHFQTVELVTYNQGFWIARVYDQFGNPLDVARLDVSTPTNNITKATVTMEEGYTESSDPYLLATFFFSHPKYFIGGTGNPFAEWPASAGTNTNRLTPSPTGICPNHYYAKLNFGNDPRVWYAGSKIQGSGVCSANIF
jgi:hypothetical protein